MEYAINRETGKLELVFDKSEYMALEESQKSEIKSAFLFSKRIGGWVSRAKEPNLWRAEQVAKKLGAECIGTTGEKLSFAEQMERKAERAAARAERYEQYSANAEVRAEQLQKPIRDMHGDIAFFTQPNINSSSGRSFTNRRNRMFASFDKGFEEYRKSEYYKERAETARITAATPTDKGFIGRRISDAEKSIRAQKRNIETYEARLEQIEAGKAITSYSGEPITAETVNGWIENALDRIDSELSKLAYYQDCMEAVGGLQFSKANVKAGDLVKVARWGIVRVKRTGPKNITFEFTQPHMKYADGTPMRGQAAYTEIDKMVNQEVVE